MTLLGVEPCHFCSYTLCSFSQVTLKLFPAQGGNVFWPSLEEELYEVVASHSFRDIFLSAQILPQHKREIDNLG